MRQILRNNLSQLKAPLLVPSWTLVGCRWLLLLFCLTIYPFYFFDFTFFLGVQPLNGLVLFLTFILFILIAAGKGSFWAPILGGFTILYLDKFTNFPHCGWSSWMPYLLLGWAGIEKFHKKEKGQLTIPLFAVLYFEFILSILYFGATAGRLQSDFWREGTMLQAVLESRAFSRFAYDFSDIDLGLKLFSYAAFLLEAFGGFIWLMPAKRFLLMALISLHLVLAICSTELTWQLSVILPLSLLYLVHRDAGNSKKIQDFYFGQPHKLIAACFVFLAFYILAVPTLQGSNFLANFHQAYKRASEYTGLAPLARFRVMHDAPRRNMCLYMAGIDKRGEVKTIYQTSLHTCIYPRSFFLQDNYLHSGVRAYLDLRSYALKRDHLGSKEIQMLRKKLSEEYSQKLGRALCRKGDYESVLATIYYSPTQEVSPRMKKINLSAYDCVKQENFREAPPHYKKIVFQKLVYYRTALADQLGM